MFLNDHKSVTHKLLELTFKYWSNDIQNLKCPNRGPLVLTNLRNS